MSKPTEWQDCPDCEGQGQVEHWGDRFNPMTGEHSTWHCDGPCDRCDGDGQIQVEIESVEPLLNDHPEFTQVFWWRPTNPPEYAAKGPFLSSSRELANREHAGGQFELLPRPDDRSRPCYTAPLPTIRQRWPRVIAAIAVLNNLYTDEATYVLENYLRGHNSVVVGYFGKTPTELVQNAIARYFESYKPGVHPDFMQRTMEAGAKYRRSRCQEMAGVVRSKTGAKL